MPQSANVLRAGDPGRAVGLVYSDESLSSGPATHVLVIGVAAYQSPEYRALLQTAVISAREVADWFVDSTKARFENPDCELGSVAVLLSETPGTAKAVYAGGEVPRASFDAAKAAVRAWVDRINTHKDNLAILYFVGHGESFLNRTAFLFEDYGMDATHDATAGMSEVEQFVGSLENARPVAQLLLFDCCRNPMAAKLPWNETIGNKLIALTRQANDHGSPRKQWVICSTSLGDYAGGIGGGCTLFNMALLDSLNGVASDSSTQGWPVRPGLLVDKVDRILSLHRLPEEKAQTPAGRMSGSFDITFPGESDDVPTYIALEDPAEWPDCTIAIKVNGASAERITGAEGESPFRMLRLPELALVEVEAEVNSTNLVRAQVKVRAPATFLSIGKPAAIRPGEIEQLRSKRGIAAAELVIKVGSSARVKKGAMATITRVDKPGGQPRELIVDLGGETTSKLAPGDYEITLKTPNGDVQTGELTLSDNQRRVVHFETEPSLHEWMSFSTIAASSVRPILNGGLESTSAATVSVEIVGAISIGPQAGRSDDWKMNVVSGPSDERFVRFEIIDEMQSRFYRIASHSIPPVFARVKTSDGREELAAVPSLGNNGHDTIGGWSPFLLVDRAAASNERLTSVVVEDSRWAGLLGFLGSRDTAMGARLLDGDLTRSAIAAIHDDFSNPLSALAGALIAVGSANQELEKQWDPWLEKLSNWFEAIPDGPIILGRRLLTSARSEQQIAQAKEWFVEGFKRGAPFYSLSVDWLARGLEALPGEDSELQDMRKAARQLANRVDPTHTFTVIRVH